MQRSCDAHVHGMLARPGTTAVCLQRRSSQRNLTLQPQSSVAKTTADFAPGTAVAKAATAAQRQGPVKASAMAPF
jgi:hypothetical protein